MMANSTWKGTERRLAKRLGAERIPVSDKRSGADIMSDYISGESKHRKTLPKWLRGAIKQAIGAATGEQLPVAILHEHGTRGDRDIVAMDMQTFETLFKSYQDIQFLKITRPDDYSSIF